MESNAIIRHEITVANKSARKDWVISLQVGNDSLFINIWSALEMLE